MQEGEENRRYRRGCPRALKTNSPTDLGTAHCRNHAHGVWVDYRTVRAALRQRTVLVVCNTRGNHADSRHIHRLRSASGEYCVVGGVRVRTPAQQVEFTDPQTGKRYCVDFLWRTRDGRIVVVELDGLVKYRDPQMMNGRTLGGVIDDERERSEGLKRAGRGRDCAHPDG